MTRHQGVRGLRITRHVALAALAACLATTPALQAQEGAVNETDVAAPAALMSQTHRFDIPAGSLDAALTAFSEQTGIQLVYQPDNARGRRVTPIVGTLTAASALQLLLEEAGLIWIPVNERTIALQRADGAALTPATSAAGGADLARRGGVEEIIVTGQKKAERLQDVPIAISAFSMEDLDAQKLEGGFDLLKAIPNVTFSKTNFTGYNFQIRGIGTQAISATTDPGVAVSFNNTTLIVNRLFEQEYLDVERVEVLRGPQGTLYGRNATAGVINVISAKPVLGDEFGEIKLEGGNYSAQRLRGHLNLPLGDTLALRAAYASTIRDGYGHNEFDGSDVDDRDLWTGRLSLGWEPTDRVRVNLMWERFEEDDERVRSTKQLCHRDTGVDLIAGYDIRQDDRQRGILSVVNQGCLPGSLYSRDAYQTPNGDALPFVSGGRDNGFFFLFAYSDPIGINPYYFGLASDPPCAEAARDIGLSLVNQCVDVFAERYQSTDLRSIYSAFAPAYRAASDILELSVDFQWTDALLFSSQTVYVDDSLYSTQDFGRFKTSPGVFNDISGPMVAPQYANFAPDGRFCDPQLGCSDTLRIQDVSRAESRQFNQEFRLVSDFDGALNFSLGANYTRFETLNDYFIFSNLLTALAMTPPFDGPIHNCTTSGGERGCVYIDPNELSQINGEGHNYFRSANPYELDSSGIFGELYWRLTDTLKLTAGARLTWDRKVFTPIPSQTLLADYRQGEPSNRNHIRDGDGPERCTFLVYLCGILGNAPDGRGYPALPDIVQTWREPTGRLVLDWQPTLPFTDETLLYASVSRGYKAGGANPPSVAAPAGLFIAQAQSAVTSPTFEPEYVDAFEIGTKNALLGGAVMLNGAAFYYDYKDYQVSKIVDRSASNENFDAKVWGLEIETIFAPSYDWQFNVALGYMRTRIANGERSIDLMDRIQGGNQSFQTAMPNPNFGVDPADASGLGADQLDNEFLVFDDWVVLKPNATLTSNCVAPAALVAMVLEQEPLVNGSPFGFPYPMSFALNGFCPGGHIVGGSYAEPVGENSLADFDLPNGSFYDPAKDAPNGGAGFFADVGGNELPNSPRFTLALGAQYGFDVGSQWRSTVRVDHYIQGKSFARVYNTEYDRLRSWNNTNLSMWAVNEHWGVTVEAYIKNLFDETPITGTFLNSDDTGLTTNVFTLDPRLVGVSITKRF